MVATKEQAMGSTQDHHHQYPQPHLLSVKGKRTKRPPRTTTLSPSSASASYTGTDDEGTDMRLTTNTATSSTTTTSAEYPSHISRSTTTAEEEEEEAEEDMANCLILLAHSSTNKNTATATQKLTAISSSSSRRRRRQQQHHQQSTVSVSVTIPKVATTTTNMMGSASPAAAGVYSYECKTCNRCFPSFQALGGHRASHKKPKPPPPTEFDRKQLSLSPFSDDGQSNDYNPSSLYLQIGTCNHNHHPTNAVSATPNSSSTIPLMSNKPKVHECTICGAEFSSGQALGGHMRRHRALLTGGGGTTPTAPAPPVSAMHPMMIGATPMVHKIQNSIEEDGKRTRNLLSLDLNLPAPEDDHRGDQQQQSKFVFKSNDSTLFFSASSLVDCHH